MNHIHQERWVKSHSKHQVGEPTIQITIEDNLTHDTVDLVARALDDNGTIWEARAPARRGELMRQSLDEREAYMMRLSKEAKVKLMQAMAEGEPYRPNEMEENLKREYQKDILNDDLPGLRKSWKSDSSNMRWLDNQISTVVEAGR